MKYDRLYSSFFFYRNIEITNMVECQHYNRTTNQNSGMTDVYGGTTTGYYDWSTDYDHITTEYHNGTTKYYYTTVEGTTEGE